MNEGDGMVALSADALGAACSSLTAEDIETMAGPVWEHMDTAEREAFGAGVLRERMRAGLAAALSKVELDTESVAPPSP